MDAGIEFGHFPFDLLLLDGHFVVHERDFDDLQSGLCYRFFSCRLSRRAGAGRRARCRTATSARATRLRVDCRGHQGRNH